MMKQFDRAINKKLGEKEFPIVNEHLAAFETLLDKKEKRKVFPFWIIGGMLLIAVIGGATFLFKDKGNTDPLQAQESQIGIALNENSINDLDGSETTDLQNNDLIKRNRVDLESKVQSEDLKEIQVSNNATSQDETGNLELSNNGQNVSPINEQTKLDASTHMVISSTDKKQTDSKKNIANEQNTSESIVPLNVDPKISKQNLNAVTIQINAVTNQIEYQPAEEKYLNDLSIVDLSGNEIARNVMALEPLKMDNANWLFSNAVDLRNERSFKKPIIKFQKSGYIGLLAESSLNKFKGGGFLQLPLSTRFMTNFQGGFAHQWDGIDFKKSSTTTITGFGLRSSTNVLKVKSVYQIFGGMELGYRMQRHMLNIGAQFGYTYGAKGDLVTHTAQDFGPTVISTQSNVWVDTKGLNKFSVDGTLGYFYQISPKLQIGLNVNIPLHGLFKNQSQSVSEGFVYDSQQQKISPSLGVRYYLIKI